MKFLFLFITTTVIIFFIYLGMATITMTPQNNDFLEVNDAIDVTYIKTIKSKPLAKLQTPSMTASLNVKPEKPNPSSILKTQLFSDINNKQSKLVEDIDMKNLPLLSHTKFHNELVHSLGKNNLDSHAIKPLPPYEAYQNNINGWVILKLFISKVGKVVDVEVLDSRPEGVFEHAAIKAAYKKEFPINEDILEPKAYTKNINIKYNATD